MNYHTIGHKAILEWLVYNSLVNHLEQHEIAALKATV